MCCLIGAEEREKTAMRQRLTALHAALLHFGEQACDTFAGHGFEKDLAIILSDVEHCRAGRAVPPIRPTGAQVVQRRADVGVMPSF